MEGFLHAPRTVELTADDDLDHPNRREVILGVVRLFVGFAALIGIVAVIGWKWRAELEHFGQWFVARFGAAGMAGGAFLADGLHFPLPPQFYLLTGMAGGYGTIPALLTAVSQIKDRRASRTDSAADFSTLARWIAEAPDDSA